ncbi:hypothetical protein [Brevundimonas sp.]|uniref:hypothetical protein n=1 Tax=Brevundimonas sp. TaxID=1871086 RepID=UPI003516DE5B
MLLYEYGRSQYAFSRILTTVERYRRSREIIDRVVPSKRVDLIVSAPKKGSFQLDVDVDTPAKDNTPSFDALFALVLDRLIPPGEEFLDLVKSLAKIRLAEIRTEEITGAAVSDHLARQIELAATGETYDVATAFALVRWARRSPNRALARADWSQEELERAEKLLASDMKRKQLVDHHKGQVDGADIDKLAGRVRPIFKELAVPLGKSADVINIGADDDKSGLYRFDRRRLQAINERHLDAEEVELTVKIKNFDVESSTGSFRSEEFKGVRRFSLDPTTKDTIQSEIIIGMERGSIDVVCAVYTDSNGIISSYLVRNVA